MGKRKNFKSVESEEITFGDLQAVDEIMQDSGDIEIEVSDDFADAIEEDIMAEEIEFLVSDGPSITTTAAPPAPKPNKSITERVVTIKSEYKEPYGGKKGFIISELGDLLKVKTEVGIVVIHKRYTK